MEAPVVQTWVSDLTPHRVLPARSTVDAHLDRTGRHEPKTRVHRSGRRELDDLTAGGRDEPAISLDHRERRSRRYRHIVPMPSIRLARAVRTGDGRRTAVLGRVVRMMTELHDPRREVERRHIRINPPEVVSRHPHLDVGSRDLNLHRVPPSGIRRQETLVARIPVAGHLVVRIIGELDQREILVDMNSQLRR